MKVRLRRRRRWTRTKEGRRRGVSLHAEAAAGSCCLVFLM